MRSRIEGGRRHPSLTISCGGADVIARKGKTGQRGWKTYRIKLLRRRVCKMDGQRHARSRARVCVCRPVFDVHAAFRRVSFVYTSLDLKDVRMLSATRAEASLERTRGGHQNLPCLPSFLPSFVVARIFQVRGALLALTFFPPQLSRGLCFPPRCNEPSFRAFSNFVRVAGFFFFFFTVE